MRILITGGAGTLGRALMPPLRQAGHTVRILTRRPRRRSTPADVEWVQGDISTGENLSDSLAGVEAVVHAASDPRNTDAVDINGTRLLLEAAAGISNIFYISIAGIDEIPFRYYRKKLEAERMIEKSGLPYTVLRATQFHSLIDMMISAAARVPIVMPLPIDFRFRSVHEPEVARRIAESIDAGPSGRLTDFGGPETMTLGEMAEIWREISGVTKRVVRLPLPGKVPAAFRAGLNTAPYGDRGVVGWRDWLLLKQRGE